MTDTENSGKSLSFLPTTKQKKMTENNENYYIDTIMAHSLRSLAGFCMGEYGKKELEIILLQLLSSIKKIPILPHRSIAVFQVFAISQEIRDIICICSICNISCIWEISSIYNIP